MAEFLSPGWVAELDAAAAGIAAPPALRVVVQQVIVDDAGGELATYALRVDGGRVRVEPGRAEDADVSFTQSRATAEAIARGDRSAQRAFLDGDLRVGGDLTRILDAAKALATVADVFGPARAGTNW